MSNNIFHRAFIEIEIWILILKVLSLINLSIIVLNNNKLFLFYIYILNFTYFNVELHGTQSVSVRTHTVTCIKYVNLFN
jgi:hypothetical protein